MTHLFNNDFTETTADSRNYLAWAMDTEIMLTTKGFNDDINKLILPYFRNNQIKQIIS